MKEDLPAGRTPRLATALALLAVVAVGILVRLLPWPGVFTSGGVLFHTDDDTVYHVLRAERIVAEFPRIPWDDPNIDYPRGVRSLWPPLFDLLIAAAAVLAHGAHPGRQAIETAAAFLPVLLGVAQIPLIWVTGRVLLGRNDAALAAGLLIALLPAHVNVSLLGRPDHHVTELLFLNLMVLFFALALRPRPGDRRVAAWVLCLGLSIALSFWNWMGSAINLMLLGGFAATWHVLVPPTADGPRPPAAALSLGAAAGLGLLGASIALFGRPGALTVVEIAGVNAFHLVLVAMTAASSLIIWAFRRHAAPDGSRLRRCGEVLLAVCAPVAIYLALPGRFGQSVLIALAHVTPANTWLDNIPEIQPLVFGGRMPLGASLKLVFGHFGLGLFAMPLLVPLLWRHGLRAFAWRPGLHLALVWGSAFFLLALLRIRFTSYLSVPMSLWLGYGVVCAADVLAVRSGRRGAIPRATVYAGLLAALLLPAAPALANNARISAGTLRELMIDALARMKQAPVPDGRESVLSQWGYGHLVQYYAGRPVVATPFGTSIGPDGMVDAARFFLAVDPRQADEVVRRRRVGHVVLTNPRDDLYNIRGFAPGGTPEALRVTKHRLRGESVRLAPAFLDFVASRLFFLDGMSPPRSAAPALGTYRLEYESPRLKSNHWFNDEQVKVFGAVAGALLTVRQGGGRNDVVVSSEVLTNQGRAFRWQSRAVFGGSLTAVLRLPYATGPNGRVKASAYRVSSGGTERRISVSESQVAGGAPILLDLD